MYYLARRFTPGCYPPCLNAGPPKVLWLACLYLTLGTPGIHAQTGEDRIEQLVITATRLPRTIENIAGTVSVISARDIEEELADDLDDLTRYQPGVSMDTASRGGNQGFSIRGIGGNRVLTVIDGIRSNDIYAAGPASYGRDSIELDDLKSVEIIRGPASVLYGADAMGGAVLIRNKTPQDYIQGDTGNYFSLRSAVDSADEHYKAGFTGAWQKQSLGVLAQYTRRQFGEHDVNGSGHLNPQDGESDGILFKSFWDIDDSNQFSITLDSFQEENSVTLLSELSSSVASSIGKDTTERTRFGVGYSWRGNSLLVEDAEVLVQRQKTDALQYTQQLRRTYSFLDPANPATYSGTTAQRDPNFEFNQETFATGINLHRSLGNSFANHDITYGINYDETRTERPRDRCETEISSGAMTCKIAAYPFAPTENFPNKTFPDSTTRRTGIYVQDEISFPDLGLTLIPGIRYDDYSMTPHEDPLLDGSGVISGIGGFDVSRVDSSATSANLGAIYELNESLSVFMQYAEGYRPPNFDESNQAFVNLGFGYATVPNPQLQAESSRGLEAGIRLGTPQVFLNASIFRNQYRDFIDSRFIGEQEGISLYQDANIGKASINGAELLSSWYLSDSWTLRGSLAYARGDNDTSDVPLDSIDPLTGVIGLGFNSSNSRWGGELVLTMVADKDRTSSPAVVTADSYQVVDVLGYYRWNESHSLRLGIFNLLDEQYARWSSIKGVATTDTTTIANAQQAGTSFRIGYNYEF